MLQHSSKILSTIALATFAGTLAFAPTAFAAEHAIDVETVANLALAGYEKGATGNLLWTLNAATGTVSPESKTSGNKLKNAKWDLKQLRLVTYSAGENFAVMESSESRFDPESKSADSEAAISVTGENFSVRGDGWSWRTGENGENIISVKRNVAVSLSVGKNAEHKKISIASNSLEITGTHDETILLFSGNVCVVQGETTMNCDSVSVKIPGNAGEKKFQKQANDSELAAIEKITGHGNVKISTDKQTVHGEEIEFRPAQKTYSVRGNARLDSPENKISVEGENASGNIEKKTTEIFGKNGTPVKVKIAAIDADPKSSASVTGKRLSLEPTSDGQLLIAFHEKVQMTDKTMSINCDELFISATHGNTPNTQKNAEQTLRKITARGNVIAISDGRTLRCTEAIVTPVENKILLTGTPNVEAPAENASLSGDKMEIFWETDSAGKKRLRNIEVYSNPKKRVTAELPDVETAANGKHSVPAPRGTKISGEHLSMICQQKVNTFDISGSVVMDSKTISGKCDRMVLFTDATPKAKNAQSVIRRIEAIGNLELREKTTRITGGKATLDVNPQVKEWLAEDDNGSDGNTCVRIEVLPDSANLTGTRPRIYLPAGGTGAFTLNIPQKIESAKSATTENQEAYIEGDSLEILAGEARTRFWLRDNIVLRTTQAQGSCNTLEGLLVPAKENSSTGTQRFDAEKIIGRGNVLIEHDGSRASAKTLEIFPQKNISVLSGNAEIIDAKGIRFTPGSSDRFIFDLTKHELVTGEISGLGSEQVSRPKITIPRGSDKSFIIPPQKK